MMQVIKSSRLRALENRFRPTGGAKVEFQRLYDAGKTVEEIAMEWGKFLEKDLPAHTLYTWVRRWRQETLDNQQEEVLA